MPNPITLYINTTTYRTELRLNSLANLPLNSCSRLPSNCLNIDSNIDFSIYLLQTKGYALFKDNILVNLQSLSGIYNDIKFPDLLEYYPQYSDLIQSLISQYNQYYLRNTQAGLLMSFDNPEVKTLYPFDEQLQLHSGDNHGINLIFPQTHIIPAKAIGYTIDFEVMCEAEYSHGYLLMPRSSLGKTPLRQANSVGLIESTYRGHIMVKVDNLSDQPYTIEKGSSLFQLVLPSLKNQWSIQMSDYLGQTQRGTGGFGSTGR